MFFWGFGSSSINSLSNPFLWLNLERGKTGHFVPHLYCFYWIRHFFQFTTITRDFNLYSCYCSFSFKNFMRYLQSLSHPHKKVKCSPSTFQSVIVFSFSPLYFLCECFFFPLPFLLFLSLSLSLSGRNEAWNLIYKRASKLLAALTFSLALPGTCLDWNGDIKKSQKGGENLTKRWPSKKWPGSLWQQFCVGPQANLTQVRVLSGTKNVPDPIWHAFLRFEPRGAILWDTFSVVSFLYLQVTSWNTIQFWTMTSCPKHFPWARRLTSWIIDVIMFFANAWLLKYWDCKFFKSRLKKRIKKSLFLALIVVTRDFLTNWTPFKEISKRLGEILYCYILL